VEVRKAALGEDHLDTLKSRSSLADAVWNQDRWNDCINLYAAVEKGRQKVLGKKKA
jgi:hypothetical protein